MNISHDKESGALYLKLREGEYDHTEDFSARADVYLDVDADGNVLGLEALSFEDLSQAIDEHGGRLELPERLDPNAYEVVLRRTFVESQGGASGSASQAADEVVSVVGQAADEASEVASQAADEASEVASQIADPEEMREVMASLEPDDRATLELLLGEGLNIAVFAERQGVSVPEAQRMRRDAYEKLNRALHRRV